MERDIIIMDPEIPKEFETKDSEVNPKQIDLEELDLEKDIDNLFI